MNPKTRNSRMTDEKRALILERYGTPTAFWNETELHLRISSDALYRAFSGKEVTERDLLSISNAWTFATFRFLDREMVLKTLNVAMKEAQKYTNVPLTYKDLMQELNEENRKEPFI